MKILILMLKLFERYVIYLCSLLTQQLGGLLSSVWIIRLSVQDRKKGRWCAQGPIYVQFTIAFFHEIKGTCHSYRTVCLAVQEVQTVSAG